MKEHIYQDAGTRDPPGTDRPHQGTASWRPEGQPGLVMTREQMAEYISVLPERGCAPGSVRQYRHDLLKFYQFLPEGKRITAGTLRNWRTDLLERGYAPPHGQRLCLRHKQLSVVAGAEGASADRTAGGGRRAA